MKLKIPKSIPHKIKKRDLNRLKRSYKKLLKNLKPKLPLILSLLLIITSITATAIWISKQPDIPRIKRSSSSLYLYEAKNDNFKVFLGDKSGSPKVSFNVRDASVTFAPQNIAQKSFQPEKSSTQITFKNVYDNADLSYETTETGVKEELILHSPPSTNTFFFNITFTGTKPTEILKGISSPYFKDSEGNYLFHMEPAFAIDAAGSRTDNVLIQIEDRQGSEPSQSEPISSEYTLKLVVEEEWLNDPARSYPITIDPTIVHDTSSEFSSGNFDRNKDTGTGSVPSIETFYQELAADEQTVGLWHFNESSENSCSGGEDACDSSGNGYHGTASGTTITSGFMDKYRSFNGSSDTMSMGDIDTVDTTDTLSSCSWVYLDSNSSSDHAIIHNAATTADGIYLFRDDVSSVNSDPDIYSIFIADSTDTSNIRLQSPPNTTPINTWTHLCFTFERNSPSGLRLYLNGDEVPDSPVDTTTIGGIDAGTNPFRVGTYAGTGGYFPGDIDEMVVSTRIFTPEEIKAMASRHPYSVYTSPVIDLTDNSSSWNSLSWDEWGVATGDGETVYDDTNLVAQWNFNETSGATANNDAEGTSCGGTPANCDGTLTGFDSTASQDADPDSSWTANNRRWGAGALEFDGTDTQVDMGNNSALQITGEITVSAWIKRNRTGTNEVIVSKYDVDTPDRAYLLYIDNSDIPHFIISPDGTNYDAADGSYPLKPDRWYHLVGTYDLSTLKLYINGQLVDSTSYAQASINNSADNLYIGRFTYTPGSHWRFSGTIDSVQLYSRTLPHHEILSLYNSAQMDFQTRVGADTSPDDGSWDAWSPTTGETQIEDYDDTYLYNTTDSGLVAYWPMDETADNSCTGGEDACDVVNSLDGTDSGSSVIIDGVFGNARGFSGSNYISVPDNNSLDITSNITLESWVKFDSVSGYQTIMGKRDVSATEANYVLRTNNDELEFYFYANSSWQIYTTSATNLTTGKWYHIAVTYDSSSPAIYVNGVASTASCTTGTCNVSMVADTNSLGIGRAGDLASQYLSGNIDEVRIYNTTLSASTILDHALLGPTNPNTLRQNTDTVIKTESTASKKYTLGSAPLEESIITLYHLDETNGDNAGNDIFDASPNNNDGEFIGSNIASNVVDGVSGKARDFNGTDDLIDLGDLGVVENTTHTISFWAKMDTAKTVPGLFSEGTPASWSNNLFILYYGDSSNSNGIRIWYMDSGGVGGSIIIYTGADVADDKWHHVAYVQESASSRVLYLDGVEVASDTTSRNALSTTSSSIGAANNNSTWQQFFDGTLDEFMTSDTAYTAEQVHELFRMGRNSYQTHSITSTDLSSKSQLVFDIASEVPGTYLEATLGESSATNHQTNENTVALLHFDEEGPNACSGGSYDTCDDSGLGNHGTLSDNTMIDKQGVMGRALYHDGTSSYATLSDNSSLDISGDFTLMAWVKRTGGTNGHIISKIDNPGGTDGGYALTHGSSGEVYCRTVNSSSYTDSYTPTGMVTTTTGWVHVTAVRNGSSCRVYINGVDSTSTANTHTTMATNNLDVRIGERAAGTSEAFYGYIDEVRIMNSSLSAEEVRQTYERSARSHPITIDFAASLDSGNLISSTSDYSFTIDATTKGLTAKGSKLYTGDKIIVRENDSGTEYIAQGTVTAVNESTGAVTVNSWDTGSTAPSGGFTVNATVFKWQREYWNIEGEFLDDHKNAVTNITLRTLGHHKGTDFWIDDLKSLTNYLTTDSGSTITSSAGNRYFQYRAILSSWDEDLSATMSATTIDYNTNDPPNTPTLDSPSSGATGQSLSPTLKTTATDTSSDYLRYKIELCENEAMTTNCQTFDQTISQTGWSGQDAETGTAYASGTQATYTLQSELTPNFTYYWRSYAIDPGGTNTWSSTQSTPYSFTTANLTYTSSCAIQETDDDSSLTVVWQDNDSNEDGFDLDRSVNEGAFSDLTTKTANSTYHVDSTVSQGNSYQYRVRTYNGTNYGEFCYTSILKLYSGDFRFENILFQ